MHRIVVLGAGYAGASAAGVLARRLHPADFEITVVNPEPHFVERMRLHQIAAGQDHKRMLLADMFAGTGIALRLGFVTALDAANNIVTINNREELEYDSLLYTLGSTVADHGIPGVREHAFHVTGEPAALRLRRRLDELGENGSVLVVGGNLTAIETATEIVESRPDLRVTLTTRGEVGPSLNAKARRHLLRSFERLGITVREHTTIDRVTSVGAVADGTVYPADVVVWAAGFAAHPIAAESGLAVEPDGRITVNRLMQSVSHPDVYAAGDSAYAVGDNGRPMPMLCASAGYTRIQATAALVGHLTGGQVPTRPLRYAGNCVSVGSKDAILQVVNANADPRSWSLRGRPASRLKARVLSAVAWGVANPTYGMPSRTHRLSRKAPSAQTADA